MQKERKKAQKGHTANSSCLLRGGVSEDCIWKIERNICLKYCDSLQGVNTRNTPVIKGDF